MSPDIAADGAPIDGRFLGFGLSPSEAELLLCEIAVAHAPSYAKLFALGIHGRALTGRDIFDSLHVAQICILHNGRFEFARNLRDAEGHTGAIIIPARDYFGLSLDLVAWTPETGAVAIWWGAASLLGEESLMASRLGRDGVRVFQNVLEWLRADRDGIVVLDAERARWVLAEQRLIVADAAFGRRLRDALRLPEPGILVEGRAAA